MTKHVGMQRARKALFDLTIPTWLLRWWSERTKQSCHACNATLDLALGEFDQCQLSRCQPVGTGAKTQVGGAKLVIGNHEGEGTGIGIAEYRAGSRQPRVGAAIAGKYQ